MTFMEKRDAPLSWDTRTTRPTNTRSACRDSDSMFSGVTQMVSQASAEVGAHDKSVTKLNSHRRTLVRCKAPCCDTGIAPSPWYGSPANTKISCEGRHRNARTSSAASCCSTAPAHLVDLLV